MGQKSGMLYMFILNTSLLLSMAERRLPLLYRYYQHRKTCGSVTVTCIGARRGVTTTKASLLALPPGERHENGRKQKREGKRQNGKAWLI